MATWGIAQAKAQLSEVVHDAEKQGPQILSRSGRLVAVVLSMEEWQGLRAKAESPQPQKEQSMAEFLTNSPLYRSGLKIPKLKWRPRKVDL